MRLHPIMYVADQYAERDFYRSLGFADHFEGEEFPGFLAVRAGDAVIGLQRASTENPPYTRGLRWQFEVDTVEQIDDLTAVCERDGRSHEVEVETGGTRFRTRLLMVTSPAGVTVVFEGPNEAT